MGLDTLEYQMEASPLPDNLQYQANAKASIGLTADRKKNKKKTLVSILPADSAPVSEYGLTWHVDAHPSMFPWGIGARPASMTPKMYVRCLAERYPLEQFAHNVGFNFDAFNQITRHDVNLHANLILKQTPGLARKIRKISTKDADMAIDAMSLSGSRLSKKLSNMTDAAKTYVNTMKRTVTRVPGAYASKMAMRSKVLAAPLVFGPFTTMLNLCMSETAASWVFEMSGKPYKFDLTGSYCCEVTPIKSHLAYPLNFYYPHLQATP